MATNSYYHGLGYRLIIILSVIALSQTLSIGKPKKKPALAKRPALVFKDESALRQAVYDSAAKFIGKTETGQNGGAWIAAINRFNGLPKNAHYCASAFYYVHAINGVNIPVRGVGMVRSYFSDARKIVYRRNQRGNQRIGPKIQMMDAVSLFVSHVEGVAQKRFDPDSDDLVRCIGFNTSGGKGTKDGCYVNFRKTRDIKAIANWITPYYASLPPVL